MSKIASTHDNNNMPHGATLHTPIIGSLGQNVNGHLSKVFKDLTNKCN
jgi:hypothetical protein